MKICIRCGEEKPTTAFYTPTQSYCIPCAKESARSSYYNRHAHNRDAARDRKRAACEAPDSLARLMLNGARKRAKQKGLPCTLTKTWIQKRVEGTCEVSGLPFTLKSGSPFLPSLDQTQPGGGYTPENVRVVCAIYNYAKHQFTHDDVLKLAQALAA